MFYFYIPGKIRGFLGDYSPEPTSKASGTKDSLPTSEARDLNLKTLSYLIL